MKKILCVFGTRPEAIKMAPLIQELKKNDSFFLVQVCVTAQHRSMLDQVMKFFKISAHWDLDIMKPNQDLFHLTQGVLLGLKETLQKAKPDLVLVHGDTTTTLVASLAAFYSKIPVGHVEGGLRTFDLKSPWPEEMNRQVTSRLSNFHFAPTLKSKNNLMNEGIQEKNICVSGNTVIDALFLTLNTLKTSPLQKKFEKMFKDLLGFKVKDKKIILITGHRRESFGKGFLNICKALHQIAKTFPEVELVYPVHLNPQVLGPVHKKLSGIKNIHLIEPLEYLPFVYLMNSSYIILTDSGGIQEEAPSLKKPVLVMRDVTERPEALDAGLIQLVGTDPVRIFEAVSKLLRSKKAYEKMTQASNPYGDGKASQKIVKYLKDHMK